MTEGETEVTGAVREVMAEGETEVTGAVREALFEHGDFRLPLGKRRVV